MLFILVSSPPPQSNNWQAFLACMFCFPNLSYVIFSRDFAFCLFWNCACIYTWIGRNLKETVFWGNITWSEIKWGNKKYKLKGPIQNLSIGCVFSSVSLFLVPSNSGPFWNGEAKITEFGGNMPESSTWLSRSPTIFPPDFTRAPSFPPITASPPTISSR